MSHENAFIRTEIADCVLTITLNRPEMLNAIDPPMIKAMLSAMHAAEEDGGVHAIVVRGAGRAFCAGADLSEVLGPTQAAVQASPLEDVFNMKAAADYWRELAQIRKPVIAAIHGYCLGAALEIALHADFAIASDDATFGYPAVRGSGLPDSHIFIYHIGPQWTRRLLMTGDTIDAATAERIGLVLKTVPRDRLDDEVAELARSVGRVPQPLAEAAKGVVHQSLELMGYTALQRENWNLAAMARFTPEVNEFGRIAAEEGIKAALVWRDTARKGPIDR